MATVQIPDWFRVGFLGAAAGTACVLIMPGMFDAFVALFARFT